MAVTEDPTLRDVIVRLDKATELQSRTLDLQERSLTELEGERYWRRVSVAVAAVVFLCFALWVSSSRQADCDRGNKARAAAREASVSDWNTAWDVLVTDDTPETEKEKEALLLAISNNQERLRPPRDCAWPS